MHLPVLGPKAFDFDAIIVGAGAAGCVLASRLSEAPDKNILLIEAGPDLRPGEEHPDIRDPFPVSSANPRFSWPDLIAEVGADPGNGQQRFSRPFLQGFGVGGSSNLTGMIAMRGQPEDYDEWRTAGLQGWGWDAVLPYFKKLERDLDFSGPLHADGGPIPIRRVKPKDWAPFSKAVAFALERRGYRLIEDCNGHFGEGVTPIPMSNLPDSRVSASIAYLTTEVRQRPNLTILPDGYVERLDISDGRVLGVTVKMSAGRRHVSASETIVACGAIYTPALLMRSGIGPADHLRGLDIEVVADIPGVGRNLQNHPEIKLAAHLRRTAVQPAMHRALGQHCLRYSSKIEGCPSNDMLIFTTNKDSWHALGRRIGTIGAYVYKSYSRGSVELVSGDPTVSPRIRFDLLSDQRDFDRLVMGLRLILELMSESEVAAVSHAIFVPDGRLAMRVHARTRWNSLQTRALATLFLSFPLIRSAALSKPIVDVASIAADLGYLRRLVRRYAQPVHHVSGTCKMGSPEDADSVVDGNCRVHGVNGLRVVDASIFPTIMSANTHLPVIMAAEKMADQVKSEWNSA